MERLRIRSRARMPGTDRLARAAFPRQATDRLFRRDWLYQDFRNDRLVPSVYMIGMGRDTDTRRDGLVAVEGNGAVPRSIHALLRAGTFGGLTDGQLLERFATPRRRGGRAGLRGPGGAARADGPARLPRRSCATSTTPRTPSRPRSWSWPARPDRSGVRDSLGPWLYRRGLPRRGRARTIEPRRRRAHEAEGRAADGRMPRTEPPDDDDAAVIHEEVARLPERYREAVVLCYLEGLTQRAGGRAAGLAGRDRPEPAGPRPRTAPRPAHPPRPGPASALAWISAESARAVPPAGLRWVDPARGCAVRRREGGGMISAAVAELTQGGLRAMF